MSKATKALSTRNKGTGIKARAKVRNAERHAKYMKAHASGKPKKTSRKDRGLPKIENV